MGPRRKGWAGISLPPSRDLLMAYHPLLVEGRVDCLEVTLDASWRGGRRDPEWFLRLRQEFAAAGRLSAHVLGFDPFAPPGDVAQERWLRRLRAETRDLRLSHLSAHFGFQRAGFLERGSPLPMPYCESALLGGVEQLQRLQHAARCPVGLENLALAFSLEEVKRQGEFLDRLLEPVNGFLLLDLHNVYCQLRNFAREPDELLRWLPLHRVRALHLSGGSWTNHGLRTIRRDTHDGPVPADCFAMLALVLPLLPKDTHVVLERMPGTAADPLCHRELRRTFGRMEEVVRQPQPLRWRPGRFMHRHLPLAGAGTDAQAYQQALLGALGLQPDGRAVRAALLSDPAVAGFQELVRAMEPELLEVAQLLLRRWGERPRVPVSGGRRAARRNLRHGRESVDKAVG